MKYILYFALLFCIGCRPHSKKDLGLLATNGFTDPKSDKPEIWTQYSTKDSIPKALFQKLNSLNNNNFEIANPEDKFQATDIITNENLPWRQLRYLGKCDTFWIMTYKHGGIGLHYHFIICHIVANEIKLFRTGVSLLDLDTLSQIKKALSDQKIAFKNLETDGAIDKI